MYKLVFFDLDGTLLDTLEDLADSVNEMLETKGYKRRSLDEIRQFVGNGMKKLIERSVPEKISEKSMEECYEIFRNNYRKNMRNKTKPYDGIVKCLEEIKLMGIKTVVVSNKNDEPVKALCKDFFGDLFADVRGVGNGILPKPDPLTITSVIDESGYDKKECILIGDSETDVLTAKNAGIESVGVLWGFRDKEVLMNYGADYIVETPSEIMKILSA